MFTLNAAKKLSFATASVAFIALGSGGAAQAARFDLKWSGEFFGNGASASGFIDFDPSQIPNPNPSPGFSLPEITPNDFSITITGATIGNGTFTLSDFTDIIFETPPNSPLDFTKELVGQPATPPSLAFGTPGSFGEAGDFNIFASNPAAPMGTSYFRITTASGFGENLTLTSFAPQSTPPTSVPEPLTILGSATALGFGALLKRESSKKKNKS